MSDQEKEPNELVISPEDCEAAFAFFKHFDVPEIPELKEALDAFKAAPSVQNQKQILFALSKQIAFSDHEIFQDEIFQKVVEEAKNISYDIEFDREIEKKLTENK